MSSVPQIPNEIAAIFQAANSTFATLQADTGEGFQGEWPPEGDHNAFVLGLTLNPGSFKQTDGKEIACADVVFNYKLIPDRTSPDFNPAADTLEFKGSRMQIVDEARLSMPAAVTRAQIDKKRLKGFLLRILGEAPTDLLAGVTQAMAKIQGPNRVALKLHIEYREGKAKVNPDGSPAGGKAPVYKTDYAKESLAS